MLDYDPPRWLRDPHLATIYAARLASAPAVTYRRERWDTPDGDFVDLDFVDGPESAPRVVLFHGLEGSSDSSYARAFMAAVRARGWRGVVPNFRGCSGELNRRPRAYHSGDSADVDFLLRRLFGGGPLFVVGVSLGGNVLCKWLGEQGAGAGEMVSSAAAICAPLDLKAAADALEQGFARVYTAWFLRTLKRGARDRLRRFGPIFDARRLETARTLRDFDEAVTAPLHGFDSADDSRALQRQAILGGRARAPAAPQRARRSVPAVGRVARGPRGRPCGGARVHTPRGSRRLRRPARRPRLAARPGARFLRPPPGVTPVFPCREVGDLLTISPSGV